MKINSFNFQNYESFLNFVKKNTKEEEIKAMMYKTHIKINFIENHKIYITYNPKLAKSWVYCHLCLETLIYYEELDNETLINLIKDYSFSYKNINVNIKK